MVYISVAEPNRHLTIASSNAPGNTGSHWAVNANDFQYGLLPASVLPRSAWEDLEMCKKRRGNFILNFYSRNIHLVTQYLFQNIIDIH